MRNKQFEKATDWIEFLTMLVMLIRKGVNDLKGTTKHLEFRPQLVRGNTQNARWHLGDITGENESLSDR